MEGILVETNNMMNQMPEMGAFDKQEFKKEIISNLKKLYRKSYDTASKQEIFQAVSYAVKDFIMDRWIATQKAYK